MREAVRVGQCPEDEVQAVESSMGNVLVARAQRYPDYPDNKDSIRRKE